MINKKEGRLYIKIPYSLKNDLKRTIPSIKFNTFGLKEWSVSARRKQELEAWLANHDVELKKNAHNFDDLVCIENTFDVKAILTKEFNAKFGEVNGQKGFWVKPDDLNEALKCIQDHRTHVQTVTQSDVIEVVIDKLQMITSDFQIFKESKYFNQLGFSAIYKGSNPNVTNLIKTLDIHISNKNSPVESTIYSYIRQFIRELGFKGTLKDLRVTEPHEYHLISVACDALSLSHLLNAEVTKLDLVKRLADLINKAGSVRKTVKLIEAYKGVSPSKSAIDRAKRGDTTDYNIVCLIDDLTKALKLKADE